MKKIVCLLLLLLSIINSFAQVKKWQKGLLKEEFIYDKASFPSCHSATIAETPAGLVVSFFGGTKERNPDVEIYVSRLVNGKWTAPYSVADGVSSAGPRLPTWNPVLYQVPGGDLLLFYKIGPKPSEWWGMMKKSSDYGKTWSEARHLPPGYIGPVKNKPVLLNNGNLFCPSSTEGEGGWKLHFEVTADQGKTWRKVFLPDAGKTIGAIQPSILDHGNGQLQLIARSRNRALITSYSKDYGESWSPLTKSNLPNNNSGTDALTMKDGRDVLVYNHVLPPGDLAKGARTPLNVAVSKDGTTWDAALILEDSPISQYSYPSVIQTADGMLNFVFTWRREKIRHVVVDPSRLQLKRIENGQWPALKGYAAPAITEGKSEEP